MGGKIIFQCFAFPRETLNLLAKHSLAKVLNFLNFASAQISEDASDISEVVLALKYISLKNIANMAAGPLSSIKKKLLFKFWMDYMEPRKSIERFLCNK